MSMFKVIFFIRLTEWKTWKKKKGKLFWHVSFTSHDTCLPHQWQTVRVLWPRALFFFAPSNWTVWITALLPANLFSQILSCTHVLLHFWLISRYIYSESWSWLSHRFSYLIHCRLMYKAIQEIIGDLQCLTIDSPFLGKHLRSYL